MEERVFMKKSFFIMGSVEAVLGILVFCITSILKELIPVMGFGAFQVHGGSFSASNYELSFAIPNVLAIILVAAGALQLVLSFRKERENSNHSDTE